MEAPMHSMNSLFDQLGLPSEALAIEEFIEEHAPLDSGTALPEAGFWTASQSAFLREKLMEDADWAEVIDELNAELHFRLED
ncbi:uncharacterized protein NMK_0143 [Novimethylophilus kurashikiensis]|uniref:DUF2789 domain-containing protein n=1 Tax=Novimethylophilus kurashikiensis TaxID=1825523 RepID=A0A2R5F1Q2_9PROT|nr:DUF2789 domain-containing protein [Novimethylophilus kurashikiensis]GBG12612.1 uncharacterized protein NMK_0143 [Novimethylophilus kurashikiensis]